MQHLIEKASKIKLLVLDIDGVLTDGQLYYSEHGESIKAFHVHDGIGIQMLLQAGIIVAIISGNTSPIIEKRAQWLGIEHIYLGYRNKLPAFSSLVESLKIPMENIACAGDDLPDLPLLTRVGLSIAVPNAHAHVLKQTHWQTHAYGGHGAVREICEFILKAQNRLGEIYDSFLIHSHAN